MNRSSMLAMQLCCQKLLPKKDSSVSLDLWRVKAAALTERSADLTEAAQCQNQAAQQKLHGTTECCGCTESPQC